MRYGIKGAVSVGKVMGGGMLLAGMVLIACTAQPNPTFPQSSPVASEGQESGHDVQAHLVHDVRQRWVLPFAAVSRPEREEHPGYVRLTGSLGGSQKYNCFVYERPLEAGQAVQRVLRALASGIAFDQVNLSSVEVQGTQPLLFFSASYHTTLQGEREIGLLELALNPRSDFPVMCVQDGNEFAKEFLDAARQLVSGFVVTAPESNPPVLHEVWKIDHEGRPTGLSSRRIWREPDGIRALSIASRFESSPSGLRSWDYAELDLVDSVGLLRKEIIELSGTQKNLQISLRRESGENSPSEGTPHTTVYEYAGHVLMSPVRGSFSSPPLDTDMALYSFLAAGKDSETLLEYRPRVRLDGPTKVQLRRLEGARVESQESDLTVLSELGGDGLPVRTTTRLGEVSVSWALLHRDGRWPEAN